MNGSFKEAIDAVAASAKLAETTIGIGTINRRTLKAGRKRST
jgi:hypothetical protein